jgi:DNA replication protein DnaC
MSDKPSTTFTPEQEIIKEIYLKTFPKHCMTIDEFEVNYYRFIKYKKYSGVPEEYLKLKFENMQVDPQQTPFVTMAKSFIESPAQFAYIYSDASGNGKTRLATNLMRYFYDNYMVYPDRVFIHDRYFASAYFMASSEYIRYLQVFKGNFKSGVELNQMLSELDFLVIDEMYGDLMNSSNEFKALAYDLFDLCVTGRARNPYFKLLWTSNKGATELGETDNRMASRIRKKNVLLISMYEYKKDWRDWRVNEK